jgi:transposase
VARIARLYDSRLRSHGTTSLFAALKVASGKVHGRCFKLHNQVEFIAFLEPLAKRHPGLELHLVCDNHGTHKHPAVAHWLAAHPRFHLHFTPTSASWLNLVERWFTLTTGQAICRGSFDSVRRLERAITRWLAQTKSPNPSVGLAPPPRSNAQSQTLLLFTTHETC